MSTTPRPLATTGLSVSPVALGCWPMAGVTTLGANEADSVATIHAALDSGVNHFDNAFVYGRNGESERLLGKALKGRRDEAVIATKGGVHFEDDGMAQDARPATLKRECDESLARLATDRVELLYLHSPDPKTPIEDSAGALRELQEAGKTLSVGASNCTLDQIKAFHAVCPLAAVQLPYNMLQRGIEQETLPWCQENGVAAMTYWPLMKGLLADKLPRDGKLEPGDKRLTYEIYQGEEWRRNQAFLAELRSIADACERTVAQVVVNWTMHRPGVTSVLCGAKRAWQIEETAGAMGWRLTADQEAAIASAIQRRGDAASNRNFK
ncbi:MAG: aldo/keto reductase [Planctomycetota bacterium]